MLKLKLISIECVSYCLCLKKKREKKVVKLGFNIECSIVINLLVIVFYVLLGV